MKKLLLAFISVTLLIASNSAFAYVCDIEYVSPPWKGGVYTTYQGWDLAVEPYIPDDPNDNIVPQPPDLGSTNPFNPQPYDGPVYYNIGVDDEAEPNIWGWTSVVMGLDWTRECFIGGHEPRGYADFAIPVSPPGTDLKKELWLQYTVFLPYQTDPGGEGIFGRTETTIWTDSDPDGESANQVSKEWKMTDGGGSEGLWWHVMELWEIDPSSDDLAYIRFLSDKGLFGTACLFDQFHIDTRCVPIPGTVLLLGSGLLGLVGLRRKRLILMK